MIPQSDSELSQLDKTLTKRPKRLQKHSQNVQNGSQHDFSLNASQTGSYKEKAIRKKSREVPEVEWKFK